MTELIHAEEASERFETLGCLSSTQPYVYFQSTLCVVRWHKQSSVSSVSVIAL